ncbi:MAG: hypothetical protein ACLFSD_00245 [Salinivenus sp.]
MSDFSTTALLDIQLNDKSVRDTKRTLSDELDDITVDVSAGGAMPSGGSGNSSRDTIRHAESQTELLEDAVIYLNSIDDHFDDGLLGGGGGGLAGELLGIGGDFASEGAGAAADAVSGLATDAIGTAIGSAAGDMIAQQISGSTVSVTPNPLPVEDDRGGGGDRTLSPTINTETELSPTFEPTFKPTFEPTIDVSPEFDLPDLDFGGGAEKVRVDESQLPLGVEREPLPVEDVGELPVEDIGPTAPSDEPVRERGSDPRTGRELLEDAAGRGGAGALAGGAIGSISPDPFTTAGGAIAGGLTGIGSTLVGEAGRRLGGGDGSSGGGGGSAPSQTITADVDYSPTYNMTIDARQLDRLADRIISEVEDRHDQDVDELRGDIDDIEDDLRELERQITRGR